MEQIFLPHEGSVLIRAPMLFARRLRREALKVRTELRQITLEGVVVSAFAYGGAMLWVLFTVLAIRWCLEGTLHYGAGLVLFVVNACILLHRDDEHTIGITNVRRIFNYHFSVADPDLDCQMPWQYRGTANTEAQLRVVVVNPDSETVLGSALDLPV